MVVKTERRENVAILTLDNEPVNALSVGRGVVRALTEKIEELIGDKDCAAIILTGEGRFFSAGADIKDFGKASLGELGTIGALFTIIENAPKAVIAALQGDALGGGMELALACHFRVAVRKARLGLPEVGLGLLPGAGGTQRLPRLAGAQHALSMLLSGNMISASQAADMGIVDLVVDQNPVAAAMNMLTEKARLPRPTIFLPIPTDLAEAVSAARRTLKTNARSLAPVKIIDCVEAMSEAAPYDGLAFETERFAELVGSEASAALRHQFFGERLVGRIPNLDAGVKPLPIGRVAVVGAGVMGTGIAIALINASVPVILIEPRADGREKAQSMIQGTIDRDQEKGRIDLGQAVERMASIRIEGDLSAAKDADLVIEAAYEDMQVKQDIFRALDNIVSRRCILASNTSTLDVNQIAGATAHPERVLGLHFFSPANIMRLLEIIRGDATSPAILATALSFASRIGKVGVVAGVCDGFIGNRMFEEYLRQAYQCVDEGATPWQVDRAMEQWGFAMGPLRVMDLAGQDIGWSIRKRRAVEQPDRPYSGFPDWLCEQGRFGQKTGRGYYLYNDGRTPTPDPEIEAAWIQYSRAQGIARRDVTDEEIVSRCLLALINEGAKIIGEGIAYRPVDVDTVFVNGYGMPRDRGGPMFQADQLGVQSVLSKIQSFRSGRAGWAWEPAPLLLELAARGASFGSLNT